MNDIERNKQELLRDAENIVNKLKEKYPYDEELREKSEGVFEEIAPLLAEAKKQLNQNNYKRAKELIELARRIGGERLTEIHREELKSLEEETRKTTVEEETRKTTVVSTESLLRDISTPNETTTETTFSDEEIERNMSEFKEDTEETQNNLSECSEIAEQSPNIEDGEKHCIELSMREITRLEKYESALKKRTQKIKTQDPKEKEVIVNANAAETAIITTMKDDLAMILKKVTIELEGKLKGKSKEETTRITQKLIIERYKPEFTAYEKAYQEYVAYIESKEEEVTETTLTAEQVLEEEEKTEAKEAVKQFEEVTDQLGIELSEIQEIDEDKVVASIETTGGVYRNIEITANTIIINDPEGEIIIDITKDLKENTRETIQKLSWEKWFEDQLKKTPLSQDQESKIKKIPEEAIEKLFTKLFSEAEYKNTESPSYIQKRKLTNLILYLSLPGSTIREKIKFLQSRLPGNRAEMEKELEE